MADNERGYSMTDDSTREYCKEEGIQLQVRSPYTPEQNSAAEQSRRNLIEKSRSLSNNANLPLSLGSEVYMTAAYFLNRTPTRSLGGKTPFEIAYKKKPILAHLYRYGCRTYPLRKQIARTNKLTPRALIGYLVRFNSTNIYRI